VAVKIKLKRLGKIRQPLYRIVVADARTKRDGRAIEEIGIYRPKEDPSFIQVDSERVQYWLGVGAQPTEAVTAILKVTGDWQTFKGLPAPEPMKVAAPKASKKELFEAAAKEAADEPKDGATTPKAKKAPKLAPAVEDAAAEAPAAEVAAPEAAADEAPAAEAAAPEAAATEAAATEAAATEAVAETTEA
jgi:small subunit ribosomal protein S16